MYGQPSRSSATWWDFYMQKKNLCTTLPLHLQALFTCKISASTDLVILFLFPSNPFTSGGSCKGCKQCHTTSKKSKGTALMCFKTMSFIKCISKHSLTIFFLQSNKDRSLPPTQGKADSVACTTATKLLTDSMALKKPKIQALLV